MEKAANIIVKIIGVILMITFGFLTIINILGTTNVVNTYNQFKEYAYYGTYNYIAVLVLIIVFGVAIYYIDKTKGLENLNTNKLLKISLIYVLGVGLFWVLMIQVRPMADQQIVFDAAKRINQGDFKYLVKGEYLDRCTFQLGIVWIFSFIQKIFGSGNYTAVMCLNVLTTVGNFYFLFKILEKITNKFYKNKNNENKAKKIQNLYLIVSFIVIAPIFYSVFVYGTIFGLFFALISVFFIMEFYEKRKPAYFCISLIFIALSNVVKGNFMIYAIAIALVLLFTAFKEKTWYFILLAALILISTLTPNIFTHYYQGKANSSNYVNAEGKKIDIVHGSSTLINIAMGMQDGDKEHSCGANGWYNGYNARTYLYANGDLDKQNKSASEEISKRLKYFGSNPLKAASFYFEKMSTQWSEPTFQVFWMYDAMGNHNNEYSPVAENLTNGIGNTLLRNIMKMLMIIVFLGNFIFLLSEFKRLNIWMLILLIIVQGGFMFSFLWEAKALYSMPYFFLSIPTGIWGAVNIYERIKVFAKNK